MKKIQLEKKLLEVCSREEYHAHPELYSSRFTAIEMPYGVVLPIKNRTTDVGTGMYYQPGAMACYVEKPENPAEYSSSQVIDYSNPSNIGEIFRNNELIRDIRNDIMTTSDNIFYLKIGDNDTPEMKALKTAINSKQVDKRQYEDRFDQFQNDMRLLKGESITLGKLVSICGAFDISAVLTLRDKYTDTPNPMNQELSVDLTERK